MSVSIFFFFDEHLVFKILKYDFTLPEMPDNYYFMYPSEKETIENIWKETKRNQTLSGSTLWATVHPWWQNMDPLFVYIKMLFISE